MRILCICRSVSIWVVKLQDNGKGNLKNNGFNLLPTFASKIGFPLKTYIFLKRNHIQMIVLPIAYFPPIPWYSAISREQKVQVEILSAL